MLTLLVDEHIPFIKGVLEPYANIIYVAGGRIEREQALKADGLIIRTRTHCGKELLDGTPVKFIATATIGYDHIDTAYCDKHNIRWHHAPGCNANSVRQYMASALAFLSLRRNLCLRGKKIGIIGVGHVGGKVAKLAETLGMIPLLNDPPRQRNENISGFVSLETICEQSDIITFHVPLNKGGPDNTLHLADDEFFSRTARNPWIINTSRGAVVATNAVKTALKNGIIKGFTGDVWENEPVPDPELLSLAAIATPHIAGYSAEGKANGTASCVRAASRFFGFGLDDWYPESLPAPEKPVLEINPEGKSAEDVIAQAILEAYDIRKDDAALRLDPSNFEGLRNHYPVRREFEAFTLFLPPLYPETKTALEQLGFHLVS